MLKDTPIIPVIVIDDASRAEGLAQALIRGGIPVAEVTFRTTAAREAIARMAAVEGLSVGAGTVVTADQVDQAAEAGARFIVSPGLSRRVVERAQELGLPVYPGVATPTEIISALDLGLRTLKLFPASLYGGLKAIKALGAPFPGVQFIPTGGIGEADVADYLALPNVAAVGGSWMATASDIARGDFDRIERLCIAAVSALNNA